MPAYSLVASNDGHSLDAKSLCPCIFAIGNCVFSLTYNNTNASFCSKVRVSLAFSPSAVRPPT